MDWSIWIGYEPREFGAYAVAWRSLQRTVTKPVGVRPVILSELQERGLYRRPTVKVLGRLQDELSRTEDFNGEMATEFAISRFFVPHIAGLGLALFMDCDVMLRADVAELFDHASRHPEYAVFCVKHDHRPVNSEKMDGCQQTRYARKNWSSVMLFNCDHPSNARLTLDTLNTVPGRDLHAFCWLEDDEIGALPPEWNYLVGHTEGVSEPKLVHFTDGIPTMTGFENCEFAGDWQDELRACAG